MAAAFPHRFHTGFHIARRRGVFQYRRRLPGHLPGEICVGLQTTSYREAARRGALLDEVFDEGLRLAKATAMDDNEQLGPILRNYLRRFLDRDMQRRSERSSGEPVYAYWWDRGDPETPSEADLKEIRGQQSTVSYYLEHSIPPEIQEEAEELVRTYGLPAHLTRPLALGLVEATLEGWKTAERRTLGLEPVVFHHEHGAPPTLPNAPETSPKPPSPLASTLVEAFGTWGIESSGWKAGAERQAKVSVNLFIEICGDRPINTYTRADGDLFRSTLRKLPTSYRKAEADREKPLATIIASAKADAAPQISEKTVKRHFWAVSRFFAFLAETGRVPPDFDNPGRGFTFNTKSAARHQRDMWTGEELRALFASPVWTGCHPYFRTRAGDAIIRDARFWLPLLGLFHGNRLEELAQLRREDVLTVDGVPYLRITDEDGRQLKNEQSRRDVPLHPELIRLGFLEYVATVALKGPDQVFPELKPGGVDKKLGYGFSKWFSGYRQQIGLKRDGLDFHSFRHGVTTKLFAANVNPGWIDLLTGHESGSESQRRYLKGVPLPQLREAIERVTWPEVNLSALYVRGPGDEGWPL